MNQKNQRGITLIALVITIIVLLILAGVTINMVLGDDGIIAQAQNAKEVQEKAEEEQTIKLAIGEAGTSEHLGVMNISDVRAVYTEAGENAQIREILEFHGKYLPIPNGMAYAFGTIDEGAVVVDGYGNEFVWVPVDDVKESGRVNYTDDEVWLVNNDKDKSDTLQIDGVPTVVSDDYEAMKTSVKIYGGFYVGRYETSWTGTKVASVGNVTPMNGANAGWYTFYTEQKKLHENSSSVVSGMIYGSQWYAIMDWMSDVENPNAIDPDNNLYIEDSTGMGHYCYDRDWNRITDEVAPIKTGSNSAYSVKNIFDLAGNYCETTQETIGDSCFGNGGEFNGDVYLYYAGSNKNFVPDEYEFGASDSSRLQLYIN